jgi:shikimate dehydrogenase
MHPENHPQTLPVKKLGLLGRELSHSFSPQWFQAKFDREHITGYRYDLYPLADLSDWPQWQTQRPDLIGLNVTIPYKQTIIPYLQGLTPEAQAIGAVNVLRREGTGWVGHNSDAAGFAHSLRPFLAAHHERAIILGRGGAAAAVRHVLTGLGISCVHVVRDRAEEAPPGVQQVALAEVTEAWARHFPLVVQATPLGTAPRIEACHPFPWEAVGPDHLVVDLVYNPPMTLFLQRAAERGATILNGQAMLEAQAQAAWDFWTLPQ